jgi:hypothetical protein
MVRTFLLFLINFKGPILVDLTEIKELRARARGCPNRIYRLCWQG